MNGLPGPSGPVRAAFYDGLSARRHEVEILPSGDRLSLSIALPDGGTVFWPLNRLRALADAADTDRLTLTLQSDEGDETPREPARLVVTDAEAIAWFRRMSPSLDARDMRAGTLRRVALWSGAAVGAVLLMLFVILPALADYMADHLPVESEVAFGHSVMRQIEWLVSEDDGKDLTCQNPDGVAALARMRDRLIGDADLGYDIRLSVFDHKMVNAFAAPGGQIVIFRGLLDKAGSADEVAGVLAHEIGHVAARDPTRIALRAAGSAGILSLVLGDVTGGAAIAAAGEHLLRTSYTREAEAAADRFAVSLLNRAAISSEGLADFFAGISRQTDLIPEYASSHPLSVRRAAAARANAEAQGATTPVLNQADWAALKSICN